MIVVAIIGILAAIAIPQYQNYTARAQASEALSLASGAKVAVAEYANTNGAFPSGTGDANAALGLAAAATIKGKYIDSVTVSDDGAGVITAAFGTGAHAKLAGGSMALTPTDNGGSISWACSSTVDATSGDPITAYLPSSCQ